MSAYAPLNKSAPDYPRRALSQSLEGDCTVEYTVQTNGRVSNAEVVPGACDERIFVRPSLAAAKEFVYRPRVVNGQAVAVPGVRNTFRYRIEQ
ncbi:energy transducer TonB [uncultured Pseudomonas sp.]|uniref:energy transducer TonB n=1 Tax=uncultured Pseudomonas sp. TaxID=114707 RepID=UPI0030D7B425